jgi:hypothetical protein
MREFIVVIAEGSSSLAAGARDYRGNRIEVRFAPFNTPERIRAPSPSGSWPSSPEVMSIRQ